VSAEYIIITPARDEETFLELTANSVISQTLPPLEWVIVDDGSTDRTPEIIQRCARAHEWITPVYLPNCGPRVNGFGPMRAFHAGMNALRLEDWRFLVKLDADISFSPDYFASCLQEFAMDSNLGIVGGLVVTESNGSASIERHPHFHVRGATKIYRRECWDAIGGLLEGPGWDTVDEVKANMLGWRTRTLEHLRIRQHRRTGAAAGWFGNTMKNGWANYVAGYHPLFMLAKCCRRAAQHPYFLQSVVLLLGYLKGYLLRRPRVADPALVSYLRHQQLRRLAGMKSIWR